jgi:small subunit ribosomal protein S21
VIFLPGLILRDSESFDDAYRRFKKQCDRNLIVTESKARRYFENNTEIKKKEKIAARKKILKKLYMLRRYESRL